ncbi:virulence factor SrfB [Pendulispora rubella]|uniref:Virulence factor SrfB n=1 Tax=Pendulispora rubella TaxID=2741070 RepID=A0ABZ2KWS2_9BACT
MVKRKVSLGEDGKGPAEGVVARSSARIEPNAGILELFFNTGVVYHEIELGSELPDTVSGFVLVQGAAGASVRRAGEGEKPTVEIAALEHIAELSNRWLPVPYQLSAPHAVQVFLSAEDARRPRILLAIDTLAYAGAAGRALDPQLDEGRPFRPLDRTELAAFLDHAETREWLRKLEAGGIERCTFKFAAVLEALAPALPRIQVSQVRPELAIPVSLVVDLGNSRSTAALVEARQEQDGRQLLTVPLELRNSLDPFRTSDATFDSRITFLPSPFDKAVAPFGTGTGFALPSIARMGREALDRALETPHRYACSLSGPKRYLWDDRATHEPWFFATSVGAPAGEYKPIFGRILKYIAEDGGGLTLRPDGPATPAEPRYAPRTMMLFALVEILSQAMAQINAPAYAAFQGKEGVPRVLRHLVMTYPSAMRAEERAVYEGLVRNAVMLVGYLLHTDSSRLPNVQPMEPGEAAGNAGQVRFDPFLFVDEALAAQMVYLYQEVAENFRGSMEELVTVYGRKEGALRVASVDIGGGTSDVMIAEYRDKMPGSGTSLAITKLFQDGVNIAGDDVCCALIEKIVFTQILAQLPTPASRTRIIHLFGESDAGHGASWRTLKAKLVPYFWLPLARCFWAIAEGFEPADHVPDKQYAVPDIARLFPSANFSTAVLEEANRFLSGVVPGFPGFQNLFFRFDRAEIEETIVSVLREPLRRYADIVAQFDVDLVVLAGRASALPCVREIFVGEMPVVGPRLKSMANYRVGDWYPSKWRHAGLIIDPKSTVAAGSMILHLASRNRLPNFLLDEVRDIEQSPIYGLYQEAEPHIPRQNEFSRNATFLYTSGMTIGFRNVDAEEMDAAPLFVVLPKNADVERALLEDRVSLTFAVDKNTVSITQVISHRNVYQFSPDDFVLRLKTIVSDRYWLDTGIFRKLLDYV